MRPTTKETLGQYCLQRLGAPVIDINVDQEQVNDRIDDALDKFYEFHSDGLEEKYLVTQIQPTDISNGYIQFNQEIFSVVKVYPFLSSSFLSGTDLFSAQYQFFLNDFYAAPGVATGNIQYYDALRTYTETIQENMNPVKSYQFNRKTQKIVFNENLATIFEKAPMLLFKVYTKIDVESYPGVWDDWFLKAYASALIKKQWGANISKYGNVTLPGGISINGDAIYSQAQEEITDLENKLIMDLQYPLDFFMG